MVIFTGMTAVSTLGPAADPVENGRIVLQLPLSRFFNRASRNDRHGLLIAKFCGSRLADSKRIIHAVEIVAREYGHGNRVVVVVSAIGKTTDQLLELTNNGSEIVETDRDDIMSMGCTAHQKFTGRLARATVAW